MTSADLSVLAQTLDLGFIFGKKKNTSEYRLIVNIWFLHYSKLFSFMYVFVCVCIYVYICLGICEREVYDRVC